MNQRVIYLFASLFLTSCVLNLTNPAWGSENEGYKDPSVTQDQTRAVTIQIQQGITLPDLPPEVHDYILSFLDPQTVSGGKNLVRVAQVCKLWHALCQKPLKCFTETWNPLTRALQKGFEKYEDKEKAIQSTREFIDTYFPNKEEVTKIKQAYFKWKNSYLSGLKEKYSVMIDTDPTFEERLLNAKFSSFLSDELINQNYFQYKQIAERSDLTEFTISDDPDIVGKRGMLYLLPPEIFGRFPLKKLKIWIDQVPLLALPSKIGNLKQLEMLIISRLDSKIPPEIRSLSNLKKLSLYDIVDSDIATDLIHKICTLTQLEKLEIIRTSLENMPSEIENLDKLKKFIFSFTPLRNLCKFNRFQKLVFLDLCCNKNLESLPKNLAELEALKTLKIYGNRYVLSASLERDIQALREQRPDIKIL